MGLHHFMFAIQSMILPTSSFYIGPPKYPQWLRVTSVQTTSFHLAWNELESSQLNGIISGYLITLNCTVKFRSVDYLHRVKNASITTFTATELQPGTTCLVSVAAVDEKGHSGPNSPFVNVTTLSEGVFIQVCRYACFILCMSFSTCV